MQSLVEYMRVRLYLATLYQLQMLCKLLEGEEICREYVRIRTTHSIAESRLFLVRSKRKVEPIDAPV